MRYFIGIDPSMNSTGICVQKYDGDEKIKEEFIILKPNNKLKPESKWLNRKEQLAQESNLPFEYMFYDKNDLTAYKEHYHFYEYWKSNNMISCANEIKNIVREFTKDDPETVQIVMEGISYGSVQRTKSIFDLAGLNYLVRENFIEKEGFYITIAPPSEIKKFASGNGNCNKEVMVSETSYCYTSNDTDYFTNSVSDSSDAWFMSNYAKKLYNENGRI